MIEVLNACRKEIDDFPNAVKGDLADALARLEAGHTLAMPLSRPMPNIGRGVHELRFRDRTGIYRVIYWLSKSGGIWLVHAFRKKTQQTPPRNLELARQRLKELNR
jgi:phage-related protein